MCKLRSVAVAWMVLGGFALAAGGDGRSGGRPAGGFSTGSSSRVGSHPAARPAAPHPSQSRPAAPPAAPSFSRGGNSRSMRQASPPISTSRSAPSVPRSAPSPSPSVGRAPPKSSAPISVPSIAPRQPPASRSAGNGGASSHAGFRSEAPETFRHDFSKGRGGSGDLRDDLPSRQIERGGQGAHDGVARMPDPAKSGRAGLGSPAGNSWRDVRNHEIAQRQPIPASFNGERSRASMPEASPGVARDGRSGGSTVRIPAVERLQRQMPMQRNATRPDSIAPNTGATNHAGAVHADGFTSASVHVHSSFDLNIAFSNSCNHFSCWHGSHGCSSGFFFCGDCLFWYWWRPGCAPCYWPYSYYYWPSCYYLPAYYPTYSEVHVVHEYVDDGGYYPQLSEEQAPAAKGADAAALAGKGWDQFKDRDYAGAAESFRQSVLANPNDATTKIAYAQSLFAIGDYADSAFLLRRALELQPDLPALGEDPRGRYGDAEDHAEQMVALRTFLDHMKGEPAATLLLGWQSYFTGDLSVARESFEALKALDPEDAVAKRFLERLGPAPAPGH